MTQATFKQSVTALVGKAKKYHDIKRQIFKAIITAAEIYNTNAQDREEYDNVLDEECKSQHIKNIASTTYLHKLTKLAIGDDTKAVSAMVHVIKVAIKLQVKPKDAIVWLVEQGGFQKIRTSYDTGGNPKGVRSASTPQFRLADKASIARDLLKNEILCRVESKALKGKVERVQVRTERVFIGVQQPDGSLVIQAIIPDEELLQAALAKYASNQAADVIEEAKHQFEQEKQQYSDLRKTPQELKRYVKLSNNPGMNNEDKPSPRVEDLCQRALDELEQVLELEQDKGRLRSYLDREFDASVNLDPELLPRLRNSRSRHNQSRLVKPTKDQAIKSVIRNRMAQQQKPNKVVAMQALAGKAKAHATHVS